MDRIDRLNQTLEHFAKLNNDGLVRDDRKFVIEVQVTRNYLVSVPSGYNGGSRECVWVEQDDNERDLFHFKNICFGPENTRKLVEFLMTLEDEPQDDEG